MVIITIYLFLGLVYSYFLDLRTRRIILRQTGLNKRFRFIPFHLLATIIWPYYFVLEIKHSIRTK